MRYEIKELGVGGILDQTITLVKNHFNLLFGVILCLYVPFIILINLVILGITPELPSNPTQSDIIAYQQATVENLVIIIPIIFLQLILIIPLTNAAVMHAVASEYLERHTSIGESIRVAFQVLIPLIITSILMDLFIFLGFLAFIIPGIYLLFRYCLSNCIVVIERISGMPALGRSKELMLSNRKRNYNTAFLLFLLLGIINWAVVSGASFIPQEHLSLIISSLLQGVTVLFGTTAIVVFYFSCRCTAEHFDLDRLAEAIEAEPSEPPQE